MVQSIKKVNLSKQLTDTIIELIENGTWTEGMKLPNEIELSAAFNVSRNIMREALKVLNSMGILDSHTGKGTFVSVGAISSIYHLQFINNLRGDSTVENALECRIIIEPELAALACRRASDEQIQLLRSSVDKQLAKDGVSPQSDFNFHLSIAEMAGNPLISNFLRSLISTLESGAYSSFPEMAAVHNRAGLEGHSKIVHAMEMHDCELVKHLMYCHLKERLDYIFYPKAEN